MTDINKNMSVTQNPLECKKNCTWHCDNKEGRVYRKEEILPKGVCPWLYHSIYPYMLAMHYGAKFPGKLGHINVCCPGENGVDLIVKRENNNGSYDKRIGKTNKTLIMAEIRKVGHCPNGHKVHEEIIFPTCMMKDYMCPAGLNNIFPFLSLPVPECINLKKLRCPDAYDLITYSIEKMKRTVRQRR